MAINPQDPEGGALLWSADGIVIKGTVQRNATFIANSGH